RRTGYPELQPVDYPGNETGGTIPRKLRYPQSEQTNNGSELDEAIDRQGPNEYTTRVWWDVEE
ncbi:MAG: SusD/RagB family nutrient-binding outer membrane lipoprotein, partial [Balneolaceae bacterium]